MKILIYAYKDKIYCNSIWILRKNINKIKVKTKINKQYLHLNNKTNTFFWNKQKFLAIFFFNRRGWNLNFDFGQKCEFYKDYV